MEVSQIQLEESPTPLFQATVYKLYVYSSLWVRKLVNSCTKSFNGRKKEKERKKKREKNNDNHAIEPHSKSNLSGLEGGRGGPQCRVHLHQSMTGKVSEKGGLERKVSSHSGNPLYTAHISKLLLLGGRFLLFSSHLARD